jgi:glucose-1-phosphate adenylyltransferase
MINKDVLAVILGGGRGTRLFPLTMLRAKPAVPLGGKFRLIDVPISNCINSGLRRIFVMTQFLSTSLNRHINSSFGGPRLQAGFVDILPAIQTDQPVEDWFLGTADSLRKHLRTLLSYEFKHFLILSGDHLYMMDYNNMYSHHLETGADITVSVKPVSADMASQFGIAKVDKKFQIEGFAEKPESEDQLKPLYIDDAQMKQFDLKDKNSRYLGSMGVYLFKREVLIKYLDDEKMIDFGNDIIPKCVESPDLKVSAYPFPDYWADIGTIESFYKTNLMLCYPDSPFRFYQQKGMIYTRPRYLPGARMYDCKVKNSIISEGCDIEKSSMEGVLVGIRTQIKNGSKIKNTVIMGADYYDIDEEHACLADCDIPLGIGKNCSIQNAIIDKNARIGDGVVINNKSGVKDFDSEQYYIRNGTVIVLKNAVIQPGTVID